MSLEQLFSKVVGAHSCYIFKDNLRSLGLFTMLTQSSSGNLVQIQDTVFSLVWCHLGHYFYISLSFVLVQGGGGGSQTISHTISILRGCMEHFGPVIGLKIFCYYRV